MHIGAVRQAHTTGALDVLFVDFHFPFFIRDVLTNLLCYVRYFSFQYLNAFTSFNCSCEPSLMVKTIANDNFLFDIATFCFFVQVGQ